VVTVPAQGRGPPHGCRPLREGSGQRSAFRHGCRWCGRSSQGKVKQGAPSRRAGMEALKPLLLQIKARREEGAGGGCRAGRNGLPYI